MCHAIVGVLFFLHIYLEIQIMDATPTLTRRHTHARIKHIPMMAQATITTAIFEMQWSRAGHECNLSRHLPRLMWSGVWS